MTTELAALSMINKEEESARTLVVLVSTKNEEHTHFTEKVALTFP